MGTGKLDGHDTAKTIFPFPNAMEGKSNPAPLVVQLEHPFLLTVPPPALHIPKFDRDEHQAKSGP